MIYASNFMKFLIRITKFLCFVHYGNLFGQFKVFVQLKSDLMHLLQQLLAKKDCKNRASSLKIYFQQFMPKHL